jgi:hypothetical protein
MDQQEKSIPRLWILALGLLLYCVFIVILTGNIGFEGDDWWVFSVPFWHSYPSALLVYAREFERPIEGFYWISLFEIFGFCRIAFQLFSLCLLATACLFMGWALSKVFPDRPRLVIFSVVFGFFLPTVSCLTYVVFTDNSRLSLLFFWVAVLAYQRWAEKSESWIGLVPPTLLYILSFLTYEAPSFLIFVMPLFLIPLHCRKTRAWPERKFLWKLGFAVLIAFGGALCSRFLWLDGGAVGQTHYLPPFALIWGYLALLPFYVIAPFTYPLPGQPWVWAVAIFAVVWVAVLVSMLGKSRSMEQRNGEFPWDRGALYPALIGLGILFLGMIPYQLAGYGAASDPLTATVLAKLGLIHGTARWFNFNEASRIYSSASCGAAILLALAATAWQRAGTCRFATAAGIGAVGFMALFHAGLSTDWKEASHIRNDLVRSLVTQVPNVRPGTNFVCLNLESYHKRAAVIRGWGGLRALVRMLYNDPDLGAWYVYPYTWIWPDETFNQAIVFPTGFVSRGMRLDKPAPNSTLLIVKRSKNHIVLVNKISAHDGTVHTGISWRGSDSLSSNPCRILAWAYTEKAPTRKQNAWTTGLISSLQLANLHTPSRLAKMWARNSRFRSRRVSCLSIGHNHTILKR